MSSQRTGTEVLNPPVEWNDSMQEPKPETANIFDERELGLRIGSTADTGVTQDWPTGRRSGLWQSVMGVSRILVVKNLGLRQRTRTEILSIWWRSSLDYEVMQRGYFRSKADSAKLSRSHRTQPSIVTVGKDGPIGDSTQTCKPTTIIGTAKKGNLGYEASSQRSHP
ncbi:hypothetical protein BS47DRAFT_1402114 [Hydnum rufescens UP504]|uniref:Uncharacterized protein n=1 Tax=Hydnum rufescens UP504 TaxID=1448309 RepID=A0A9P6DMN5_9AGAM|nr:hypothetical protein BS47DRAFT_1402114 [Hydnum rufescens UP504]